MINELEVTAQLTIPTKRLTDVVSGHLEAGEVPVTDAWLNGAALLEMLDGAADSLPMDLLLEKVAAVCAAQSKDEETRTFESGPLAEQFRSYLRFHGADLATEQS
ncbi:MAG: hypothetical protein AAF563_04675 [Pseudomonadota bacterium]